MRMIYRAYVRSCSRAQCSPALAVAGVLLAIGITCYIYRQVIFTTVLAAVAALVAVAAVAACTAITVSTVRYFRAARVVALERPAPDTWTKAEPEVTDADVRAISDEADWLEAAGSVLVFDKDGNLHAAERKAE